MNAKYSRIARRIRVPLGFIVAAVYLWLAQPTGATMALGAFVVVPGLWLRAAAAGHVRKNAELTTTGPYAYTRNPLYLGSVLIALGFAIAARNVWSGMLLAALFVAIYLPVISSEETHLRTAFSGFEEYARRVPRLLPRLRAEGPAGARFSRSLYFKHREYNALIGALAMYTALAVKVLR